MMRKVGIMPDIRLKTPDMVVEYAIFDGAETLEITPKMAFSSRYETLVFILGRTM